MVDEAKILDGSIRDEENLFFHFEKKSLKEVLSGIEKSSYSGVLYVPAIKEVMEKQYTVFYYAAKQPGLSIQFKIKDRVEDALRDFKIVQLKLDKEQIAAPGY